jgi:RNA polymerase subunit RPABC4/transcription elongation factor Spt4
VSRHLGSSPQTGEAVRAPRNWTQPAFALVAVLIVVLGSSLVLATSVVPREGASVAPAVSPAVPPTHGDLVVASGETYTIQPTGGVPIYYQGGNITVESGGTLNVKNVSLIFVEFVSNTGTPLSRLSHIYTFTDAGTVNVYNSTITTDMSVLNAYAKLNLIVTGAMTLWDSALAFPGWVTVTGSSGDLTLNQSKIEANPAVAFTIEPLTIQGDTEFAPSLTVSAGAQLNLFGSQVLDTYADDTVENGMPAPTPLFANITDGAGGANQTAFATPTDSANLTLDWLYYPVGVGAGYVAAVYNDSGPAPSTVPVTVWYLGVPYPLSTPLSFKNDTTLGETAVELPANLIAAINAAGLLTYLNSTGDFGTPSAIALNFSAPTGPAVQFQVAFQLLPPLQFNMVATGAGSTVTTVDSTLGLTFAALPNSPYSQAYPVPWASNKFLFSNGATAYFGNLTTTSPIPGVFSTSAIITDATSTAYLYRWAQFNITSVGQHYNVSGALATAFYAYDDNQASNATATALNDLSTADPALWGYVQYWDSLQGVSRYGSSNIYGQASLLLASSELNSSTLPTGNFLGGYHVGFRTPYINNATWISYAVNPYPIGAAVGTPGYGQSDRVNVSVPMAPPVVKFLTFNVPTSPLDLNNQYASSGTIFLNGPGTALIEVYASPVGGGSPVMIGVDSAATNGTFSFAWYMLSGLLSPGSSYAISATATYKTATATYSLGTYSVPSTTSPVGFLLQKFLGLPFWMWIAIAAAAVVAILVVLMIFRRQAAGKLVECGECGELIPEDATVCPKCGAEFESDLVRCSRCSSTIPANSKFCPECAAQLLGSPEEAASDPERQAYADFTERFRAEGKKELGDNYTESAFWDWWKRQPTYVPFSQWKVQQNKGAPRSGMSQPPVGSESAMPTSTPPRAGAPPTSGPGSPAPGAGVGFTQPPMAAAAPTPAGGPSLKPCPNCGKEIPPEYLVCPFCGAVTQ